MDPTSLSVLIVDDEPAIRRTTRVAVETAGHRAREASGLERADRALGDGPLDAVLLDLHLGDGNGLALIPRIRESQPGAAIIVFTAYARIADAVEAMRLGALDFIPKPFGPAQIRAMLDTVARARAAAPSAASPGGVGAGAGGPPAAGAPLTLDALEAEHIRRVLGSARSLDEAASTLGIDPATLYRKRRALGLGARGLRRPPRPAGMS